MMDTLIEAMARTFLHLTRKPRPKRRWHHERAHCRRLLWQLQQDRCPRLLDPVDTLDWIEDLLLTFLAEEIIRW